jgi:hypothetical protein
MTRRRFIAPAQLGLATSVETSAPTTLEPPVSVAVEVAEVLGLSIRLLRAMPLPSTLLCSFAHGGGCVVLATVTPSPGPGVLPPVPAFVGPEVDALALAAEHDRASMRAWAERKPDWRLTRTEVVAGLGFRPEPLGWSTERVLWALGLRLDEVWL